MVQMLSLAQIFCGYFPQIGMNISCVSSKYLREIFTDFFKNNLRIGRQLMIEIEYKPLY